MGGPPNFTFYLGQFPQISMLLAQPIHTVLISRIKHNIIGLAYMVTLLNPDSVTTHKYKEVNNDN